MRKFTKISIFTLLELLEDIERGKRNYAKQEKCYQGNVVLRTSPWFSPQVKGEALGTRLRPRVIYSPSRSAYSVLTSSLHYAFLSLVSLPSLSVKCPLKRDVLFSNHFFWCSSPLILLTRLCKSMEGNFFAVLVL